MKSGSIFIIIICFIIGCTSTPKVPKDIIGFEKMQGVLWDVLTADSWARQTSNRDTTVIYTDEVKSLSRRALDFYGITQDEFDKSYAWYTKHPEVFLQIIDSIETRKHREDSLKLLPRTKGEQMIPEDRTPGREEIERIEETRQNPIQIRRDNKNIPPVQ